LKDDARLAIRNIHVSGHNYAFAWQTLIDRFDKPRQLAMVFVEKLLSAPVHSQESLIGLKEFLVLFSDNVHMLRSLNVPDLGEFLLFVLSSRCLPISTRRQFELKSTGDFPEVAELVDFIKTRIAAFETAGTSSDSCHPPIRLEQSKGSNITQSNFQRKSNAILVSTKPESFAPPKCSFCTGPHVESNCPQFIVLPADERSKLAREKRVCFRCLSSTHWSNKCRARNSCKICSRHHHSLLHPEIPVSTIDVSAALIGQSRQPTVLLGTALIHVQNAAGCMQPVRALIDSASQISVITSGCVDRLGLRWRKWTVPLSGIAGVQVPNVEGVVDCCITLRYAPDDILRITAGILPRVTGTMPSRQFPTSLKEKFAHLALADPEFDCPVSMDLLLVADVFSQVFDGKRVLVDDSLPAAYSSLFGWIIIGLVLDSTMTNYSSHLVSLTVTLEDTIERFWRIEEPELAPPNFTEEGKCEEIYSSKRTRDASGRFVVQLPFRGPIEKE